MTTTLSPAQPVHTDTREALAVSSSLLGKVTTAYAREKQLLLGSAPQVALAAGGTPVGADATPRQAFAAAGADFKVGSRPLAFSRTLPEDAPAAFDGGITSHKAIVREDTGHLLGVVGTGYTPVQNESLIQLFEFLREDAQIENIVVLKNGRRVFATATIDIEGEVKEGDKVRRYLHAFNSHDGSSAFGVFFSDLRIVCANQLRYIAGRGSSRAAAEGFGLKMRHTRSVSEFAKNLPHLLNLETQRFSRDLEQLRPLTTARLSPEGAKTILEATFADKLAVPTTDKETGKKRERTLADLDTEIATIRSHAYGSTGIGIDPSDRSVWNMFQAVTQYMTHDTGRAKDETERARARLESLWGGSSAKAIDRALDACLALV